MSDDDNGWAFRKTTLTIPDPINDAEDEVFALRHEDQPVAMVSRTHLADFITRFGLHREEDVMPRSFQAIENQGRNRPGGLFRVVELEDGSHVGVKPNVVVRAIAMATDEHPFEAHNIQLWLPSRAVPNSGGDPFAPFVLESAYIPDEWVVRGVFEDESAFADEFGVAACDQCQTQFDVPIVRCPECGDYPSSVADNIEKARASIDSILLVLMPYFPDPNEIEAWEGAEEPDVDDVIDEYIEATGDKALNDEERLDEYLRQRGVL